MSRPESRIPRVRLTPAAAVVSAMIGAVALTGCGAGQVTQTSQQVAAVGGANVTVGTIAVRNAQIEFDTAADGAAVYPAGASAPLTASIVNTGGEADRLVAASSPAASAVEISGATVVPGGRALVVEGVPAPPAPAPPVESSAPAGDAEEGATAVPPPTSPTSAPAPIAAAPADGTASIVLTGLREDLRSGPTYPVVLTFERAGDVLVEVPIGNPDTPRVDEH